MSGSQDPHEENQLAGATAASFSSVQAGYAAVHAVQGSISCNLSRHRDKLLDLLEPDYGLLDQLLSLGVLGRHEHDDVSSKRTLRKRNDRLLNYLATKDEGHLERFLTALERTSQQHVVNYIQTTGSDEDQPLDKDPLLKINTNTPRLVELIEPNEGFLAELATAGCITWLQRDVIRETQFTHRKNWTLLDMMTRKSVASFNKFIDCLCKNKQEHIVPLLLTAGVVVNVHSELDESAIEDVERTESQIESEFRVSLPDDSPENRGQVLARVEELSDALKELGYGVNLVSVRKLDSIGSYFLCTATEALERLRELYTSGRLKSLLESIFSILIDSQDVVPIKTVIWSEEDYERCLRCFVQLSDVCQLYTRRPVLQAKLQTKDNVRGVAQLEDRIYIVCCESDTIEVFDSRFRHVENIRLEVLQYPFDIAVCKETRAIYISDWDSECVWRVTQKRQLSKFIPSAEKPATLSVTSRRLLVTSRCELRLFGPDGEQINQVSLPGDMYAEHAVETKLETFVVCHAGCQYVISEVDVYGHVIRTCNEELYWSRHLALDATGLVFVADSDNDRVLLLNKELQLERVLLDEEHHELFGPCRLCYVPETDFLLVGDDVYPGRTNVYLLR